MSGQDNEIKGMIKEATGVLTGDVKPMSEGNVDEAVGNVKQSVENRVENLKRISIKP